MPDVNLPMPFWGKNDKETIEILFDTVLKLRKELEFLMYNLDTKNVIKAKSAEEADAYFGTISADQITTGTLDASQITVKNLSADSINTGTLDADKVNVINLDAEMIVTNNLITQTLYAEKGMIAELTVDRLDTSTKVQNYLNEDTSDVNYIRMQDQEIEFVEATTDGEADEQLLDRNNNPVYWTDETFAGITLEETDYPVMIYVYDEVVKMKLSFQLIESVYTPIMQFGVGTGVGDNGKGFLVKTTSGFEFKYITNDIEQIITNGDDGILVSGCDTKNPNIRNIWDGTQAEYDAIEEKEAKTVYLIHD
jgi:hypothetical protein